MLKSTSILKEGLPGPGFPLVLMFFSIMHCLVISFVVNYYSLPTVLKRKYLKNTLFNTEYISVYFGCLKIFKSPFRIPERPMAFHTPQDFLTQTYIWQKNYHSSFFRPHLTTHIDRKETHTDIALYIYRFMYRYTVHNLWILILILCTQLI